MSITWLHKQRKGDLQQLAKQAGIESYDDLLKDDLVSALDTELKANPSAYASNPVFSEFFSRGGSPVKKERAPSASLGEAGEAKPQRRRRTIVKPKEEPDSPLSESAPDPSTALATRTPRAVQRLAARVPLPPSPQVIANMIGRQQEQVGNKISAAWEKSGTTEFIESVRATASTVVGVELLALLLESYGLQQETFPWAYAFDVPAVDALGTSSYAVKLPDLFLLFTQFFWAPSSLWLSTSVFIPLLFAYFFNFTSQIKTPRTRAASASVYRVDPLTYNVVKALTTWLVYSQGFRLGGLVTDETVARVNGAFPGGYYGVLIGSGVGALASIYEAILQKH